MPMHYPKTEAEWLALRHQNISSTESAALFGLGSYQTPFELGISKQAKDPPEGLIENERMKWGKRLQEAIAKGLSDDYGVKIRRVTGYAVHENCRIGASFDYEIVGIKTDEAGHELKVEDISLQQMYRDLGPGVLEIKNVDRLEFIQNWKKIKDDNLGAEQSFELEAPPQFEVQVQHQLEAIGTRKWSTIGVLVGGNQTYLVLREHDPEFGAKIRYKAHEFWANLKEGKLPPVLLPQDVEIIRKIYLSSAKGKVYAGNEDIELAALAKAYNEAKELRDVHENARKSIAARILMRIQDHEAAVCPGYRIMAGTVSETVIPEHTRKAYRMMRITEVKAKEEKK